MPDKTTTTSHRVRVDYKAGDHEAPKAIPASSSKKTLSSDDAKGNGRIRLALAVVGTVGVGAAVANMLEADQQPDTLAQAQPAITPLAAMTPATDQIVADNTTAPQDDEPMTPQFLFATSHTTQPLPANQDIPFVEVDIIDDTIPLGTNVVVGNAVPFTAAAPELPNDYTQEPSTLLIEVKKGDTLSGLLANHGLSSTEIANLANLPDVKTHMTSLRPGYEIQLDLDGSRRLTGLTREIDLEKTLHVKRIEDNQFQANVDVQALEKKVQLAELTLESSLFLDGAKAGLSESVIMELYSIFQWTVDFNREVRTGDKLLVLHEAFYKNGAQVKRGNILAAEYHSSNDVHNAYRHINNGKIGYYDGDGQSLEKQFLRNPIKARITSRFNLKRKHPIRHTIIAHKGVDYGAPTGTAVSSAGAGQVTYAGPRGTYGNTVEIQHGERHTTLYAHLQKFPPNIKKGSRVKQGQVIGYVGSTGLATGPHLHYEFRIDGIHRDPQKVKLGGSTPLAKDELLVFKNNIEPLRAQLAASRTDSDTLAMR